MTESSRPSIESTLQKADQYFNSGYNCAESVLLAMSERFGLQDPLIPRIATAFGGGLSRKQMTCGALSGAMMVIGLRLGRDNGEEAKDPSYLLGQKLVDYFIGLKHSINCREIVGVDLLIPEVSARFKEEGHRTICTPLVKEVCRWLIDNLE